MNDQKSQKNLSELPASSDIDFWADGQRFSHKAIPVKICGTHGKKWMKHTGYIDNHGTITCKWCPWGTTTPGYLKVLNERIIDLRSVSRE